MFNLFKRKTCIKTKIFLFIILLVNIGDKIDYGQRYNTRLGELI